MIHRLFLTNFFNWWIFFIYWWRREGISHVTSMNQNVSIIFFIIPHWEKSSCIIRVNLERDGVILAFSCSFCTLHAEFWSEFVSLWIWITTDVRRPPCLCATLWKIFIGWFWQEQESHTIVYKDLANNKSYS